MARHDHYESISNSEDIIDSRTLLARIAWLESERQVLIDDIAEASVKAGAVVNATAALAAWDGDDDGRELVLLRDFAKELEGYGDFARGETIIRESYFAEYAEDLAAQLGMLDSKVSSQWPYTCIDWNKAAQELRQDYTEAEFDGVTYLMRS